MDTEIKKILLKRFDEIAKSELELNLDSLNKGNLIEQQNPFPFPHADSEIYYRKMYVGLKSGVHSSECSGNNLKPNFEKVWDAPIFDITASNSYTTLALATGSEGLFQLKVHPQKDNEQKETPKNISNEHCTYCDWSYFNIYATSYTSSSFFAAFKKNKDPKNSKKKIREFDKIITEQEIFKESNNESGFSWGIHDKIYTYRDDGTIKAIRYSSKRDGSPKFTPIGTLNLDKDYGKIISAKAASFGTVVEFEESIVVVSSNEEVFSIPGEPVNWRIFLNSKNYTNQLHIIYEDRLEIYSFYNDYFVDQKTKVSGINMID
ncbi:conserved hypothetical protein [Hyella patelloides LEGE 07179]|uniref:Uncharacterized protein n=1 Tax=Hyella patelloides LEGE 07179 TaxID=945734 RepID=A0A563W5C6_9CYAN|nr:hypothetical protein [Hyella patelloides]VEP18909.1 conserved hypothetical protein [Hyella patelloides LEGE 07179]